MFGTENKWFDEIELISDLPLSLLHALQQLAERFVLNAHHVDVGFERAQRIGEGPRSRGEGPRYRSQTRSVDDGAGQSERVLWERHRGRHREAGRSGRAAREREQGGQVALHPTEAGE